MHCKRLVSKYPGTLEIRQNEFTFCTFSERYRIFLSKKFRKDAVSNVYKTYILYIFVTACYQSVKKKSIFSSFSQKQPIRARGGAQLSVTPQLAKLTDSSSGNPVMNVRLARVATDDVG